MEANFKTQAKALAKQRKEIPAAQLAALHEYIQRLPGLREAPDRQRLAHVTLTYILLCRGSPPTYACGSMGKPCPTVDGSSKS